MAEVDFSNAIIECLRSPFFKDYICLNGATTRDNFLNASGSREISSGTTRPITAETTAGGFVVHVVGTFTASGTEVYYNNNYDRNHIWKISNISFNSGDTYDFEIPVVLTCN